MGFTPAPPPSSPSFEVGENRKNCPDSKGTQARADGFLRGSNEEGTQDAGVEGKMRKGILVRGVHEHITKEIKSKHTRTHAVKQRSAVR